MTECPECGCEKCRADIMQMVKGEPHLWYECPRCRLRFVRPYEKDEKNLTNPQKNDRMRQKANDGIGK
jgi:hypothetical protein